MGRAVTIEAEIDRRKKISEASKLHSWNRGLTVETSVKMRDLVAKAAEKKRGKPRSAESILKSSAGVKRLYKEHPERKAYLIESGRRLAQPNIHHNGHKPGEYIISDETRKKIQRSVIESYKNHPEIKEKLRKARLRQIFPMKDTKCEKAMQRALDSIGISYQKHLPTLNLLQPDMVISDKKIAIYVDGCYWHCCPVHFPKPKSPAQWKNIICDRKSNALLKENGWLIFRFWEHEVLENSALCAMQVNKANVA